MKRITSVLIGLFLCCGFASAQGSVDETFQFIDADGHVVPDGAVITVSEAVDDGFSPVMSVPLSVRNVSGERAAVSMYETIDALPGGTWQTCAFGSCKVLAASGYSPKSIVADDYEADIATEWIPDDSGYTTWEATLQIHVFGIVRRTQFGQTVEEPGDEVIARGPTVTVHFIYSDPTGIEAMSASPRTTNAAVYDLSGRKRRDSALPAGLYITQARKMRVRK